MRLITYESSSVLTKIGFCLGFLTNIFLIHLTVFHIKKIFGTYKIMVISFASLGIIFSGWELISKPFMHNYNNAMVYFSLNPGESISPAFSQFGIAFYAFIYESTVAFIAVQFAYRYFTLFQPEIAKRFDGRGVFFWMVYPLIPGLIYFSSFYMYCQPDQFSDDYVREEMLSNYELVIEHIPRFVIVSYDSTGSLRWNSLCFIIQGVAVLGVHYALIIFFGLKMHFNMKTRLESFSATYQSLQKQFFRALVVQTMAPTLMFVLPAGPILLGPLLSPLLGIPISLQTGWLCSVFSLYPPFDSIAFMIIVTEYKTVIKNQLKYVSTTSEVTIQMQDRIV